MTSGVAQARISQGERTVFARLADFLIPAHGEMPGATAVGAHQARLDEVLSARPDLLDDLKRALAKAGDRAVDVAANELHRDDPEAFNALILAATGAYYMSPEVWRRLGYPGQEKVTYDPHATPEYLTNGMLERVIRRGPVYRSDKT